MRKPVDKYADTEYDACRKIEARYINLGPRVQFSKQPKYFQKLGDLLSGLLNYRAPILMALPRATEEEWQEYIKTGRGLLRGQYHGEHKKRQRGIIKMAATAGLSTYLHEYTHHVVFVEGLNAFEPGISACHSKDFLWVEELIFDTVSKGIRL